MCLYLSVTPNVKIYVCFQSMYKYEIQIQSKSHKIKNLVILRLNLFNLVWFMNVFIQGSYTQFQKAVGVSYYYCFQNVSLKRRYLRPFTPPFVKFFRRCSYWVFFKFDFLFTLSLLKDITKFNICGFIPSMITYNVSPQSINLI